ncbi:MAG: shikimate dehydrogenase [Armatimonadota bacterium]|jgi:predicted amino acid dehydrogenase|nr:shikimate dehydrogenase [Armatimonadota bacterium]MDT7971770.1 shikimate dehydrogenase [Armatimonadota bacterium]
MRATEVTAVFRFAFLVHPLDLKRDVARKYPVAKWLPESWVEALLRRMRVKVLGKITGVRSLTGATTEGWLLGIPMTAKMMLADERRALGLLAEACRLAADLGAHIVGLGAYTAIVGNNGVELQKMSPLPVTTGNSYTTWTAVEATKLAAEAMGIEWERATAAVVGATGSIGKACAFLLVNGTGDAGRAETTANAEGQMANSGVHLPPVAEVVLVGRNRQRLETVREEVMNGDGQSTTGAKASVRMTTNIAEGLKDADVVITVTSAMDAVIEPEHLKPGCVVCDVARPRDVSERVRKERDDVLVIDGGIVRIPGEPHWEFSIGLPEDRTLACVAETMLLALEGRLEPFTLGRDIPIGRVLEIAAMAARHGFCVDGFRSFERLLLPDEVAQIRQRAKVAAQR